MEKFCHIHVYKLKTNEKTNIQVRNYQLKKLYNPLKALCMLHC